jgi:hypothetical protein
MALLAAPWRFSCAQTRLRVALVAANRVAVVPDVRAYALIMHLASSCCFAAGLTRRSHRCYTMQVWVTAHAF